MNCGSKVLTGRRACWRERNGRGVDRQTERVGWRERERERERECVCVCERERERESVCVCVCERERERTAT